MLDILQTKRYNERYSLPTALWKFQEFLRTVQDDTSYPNDEVEEKMERKKSALKQKSLNFHSVLNECQTMIDSHCQKSLHSNFLSKYKEIKQSEFRKRCTLFEFVNEIKTIAEIFNLECETDSNDNSTSISFGSADPQHWLFALQIVVSHKSLTIDISQSSMDFMVKSPKTDSWEQLSMEKYDFVSIINHLAILLNYGHFGQFYKDMSLLMQFDSICNTMPSCNLSILNVMQIVSDYMQQMCQSTNDDGITDNDINNDYSCQRLIYGPSLTYHISLKEKNKTAQLQQEEQQQQTQQQQMQSETDASKCCIDFVGVYPKSLFCDNSQLFVKNSNYSKANYLIDIIQLPYVENNSMSQFTQHKNIIGSIETIGNEETDELLYWFVLKPSLIVPFDVAQKIDEICLNDGSEDIDMTINVNKIKPLS